LKIACECFYEQKQFSPKESFGQNPCLRQAGRRFLAGLNNIGNLDAPVAQLDRAAAYGAVGWGFDSLRVHNFFCANHMEYSVYILLSLSDYKHYTGLSANVQKRLNMHNSGKVKSTKPRRPFVVVYKEKVGSLKEARKREKYFKTAAGRSFLNNILSKY
jgi:putative endonuclease